MAPGTRVPMAAQVCGPTSGGVHVGGGGHDDVSLEERVPERHHDRASVLGARDGVVETLADETPGGRLHGADPTAEVPRTARVQAAPGGYSSSTSGP